MEKRVRENEKVKKMSRRRILRRRPVTEIIIQRDNIYHTPLVASRKHF
jgi:hypothetical protein